MIRSKAKDDCKYMLACSCQRNETGVRMKLRFRHLIIMLSTLSLLAAPNEETPADPAPPEETRTPAQIEAGNRFAQDVMLQALELIGVKYVYGGAKPETGLDCSGFIRYVFQQTLNIALPHNAFAISKLGEEVDKDALKPGDLVFFNTLGRRFSHVGIYMGDDRFIHSPSTGGKIEVVKLSDKYWAKHWNGGRRVTHDTVSTRQPRLAQMLKEDPPTPTRGKGGKAASKKHGKAQKGGKRGAGHHAAKKKHR